MSRRALATAAAVALVATASAGMAGCSSADHPLAVEEGTPVFLGNLEYAVQISRFLNPKDAEDKAYLKGAPSLPRDAYYFAVFLEVNNHGSTREGLPTRYAVTDTEHNAYPPIKLHNDFTMPLGGSIAPGGRLPDPESIAGNGPIGGMMLLFEIRTPSLENRPLTLKIPAAGDRAPGRIELDL
jgi:hypothetical protein